MRKGESRLAVPPRNINNTTENFILDVPEEKELPSIPLDLSEPLPKDEDDDESGPREEIVYKAQSPVMVEFLSSSEDEVLLAGGRGGGKSLALLVDPLPYCDNRKFRGLVLRRTMKELRELIDRGKQMYPKLKEATWMQQEALFRFPSGARIEFGYCQTEDDLAQYQGQEYTWIGVDEVTQFPYENMLDKLNASIRSTDPLLPKHIRCTTNPNGPGRRWVKERFINLAPPGKTIKIVQNTAIGEIYTTRKWLHSTIYDNPILLQNDPKYLASLMQMQGALREQWLEGSWAGGEGVAFPEFSRQTHVIAPFPIPHEWPKFRSCDWGYGRSRAATLWFAIDPSDQTVYCYREFVCNGGKVEYTDKLTAPQYARRILEIEAGENIKYGVIDGKTVARKGGMEGPTIEDQMRQVGLKWKHADQSKDSRIHGKNLFHEFLRIDEYTNKPKLQIFDTCPGFIGEMEDLPLDDLNPEDVDTDAPDDIYDAARYFLMSRFKNYLNDSLWGSYQQISNNNPIMIDPVYGH